MSSTSNQVISTAGTSTGTPITIGTTSGALALSSSTVSSGFLWSGNSIREIEVYYVYTGTYAPMVSCEHITWEDGIITITNSGLVDVSKGVKVIILKYGKQWKAFTGISSGGKSGGYIRTDNTNGASSLVLYAYTRSTLWRKEGLVDKCGRVCKGVLNDG